MLRDGQNFEYGECACREPGKLVGERTLAQRYAVTTSGLWEAASPWPCRVLHLAGECLACNVHGGERIDNGPNRCAIHVGDAKSVCSQAALAEMCEGAGGQTLAARHAVHIEALFFDALKSPAHALSLFWIPVGFVWPL